MAKINGEELLMRPTGLLALQHKAPKRLVDTLTAWHLKHLRDDSMRAARAYRASNWPENTSTCVRFARERNWFLVRLMQECAERCKHGKRRSQQCPHCIGSFESETPVPNLGSLVPHGASL